MVLIIQKVILAFSLIGLALYMSIKHRDIFNEDDIEKILAGRSALNRSLNAISWVATLIGAAITSFAMSGTILICGIAIYFFFGLTLRVALLEKTSTLYFDYKNTADSPQRNCSQN